MAQIGASVCDATSGAFSHFLFLPRRSPPSLPYSSELYVGLDMSSLTDVSAGPFNRGDCVSVVPSMEAACIQPFPHDSLVTRPLAGSADDAGGGGVLIVVLRACSQSSPLASSSSASCSRVIFCVQLVICQLSLLCHAIELWCSACS